MKVYFWLGSISPNLFLIGGPTTTTCFVVFSSLTSSVLSFIFFLYHFFWPTVSKYTTGVVSFRLISFRVAYTYPNSNPNPSSISVGALQYTQLGERLGEMRRHRTSATKIFVNVKFLHYYARCDMCTFTSR